MNRIKPCMQGLLLEVVSLLAPVLVLFALPFVRWDLTETSDEAGDVAIRGDLPRWLAWLGTPDERPPGGLYESTVKKIYQKYGKYVTTWYWLGIRNRMHGLNYLFRKPTTGYFEKEGLEDRPDGTWRYVKPLGFLQFVAGYRSYLIDGQFWAIPVFTVKRK